MRKYGKPNSDMHFLSRQTTSELAPFVLRLALGCIFFVHGLLKFLHMAGAIASFTKIGVPLPGVAAPAIALLEILGGIVLILGPALAMRVLALLLAIEMLVAIVLAKRSLGFVGGYEFEVILFAALLALVLSGPGRPALTRR